VLLGCSGGSSSGSNLAPPIDAALDASSEASTDSALDTRDDGPVEVAGEQAPDSGDGDATGDQGAPQTCAWEKVNLTVTLNRFRGISGTSPNDIIVVGSGPSEWMIRTAWCSPGA
jgi:hypothetical protein